MRARTSATSASEGDVGRPTGASRSGGAVMRRARRPGARRSR
jgi:hypothetical protein